MLDNQGRKVATLFQGEAKANQTQEIEWKVQNQNPGFYLLELQTPTPTKHHYFKLLRNN